MIDIDTRLVVSSAYLVVVDHYPSELRQEVLVVVVVGPVVMVVRVVMEEMEVNRISPESGVVSTDVSVVMYPIIHQTRLRRGMRVGSANSLGNEIFVAFVVVPKDRKRSRFDRLVDPRRERTSLLQVK
jgi:hypothetical protein